MSWAETRTSRLVISYAYWIICKPAVWVSSSVGVSDPVSEAAVDNPLARPQDRLSTSALSEETMAWWSTEALSVTVLHPPPPASILHHTADQTERGKSIQILVRPIISKRIYIYIAPGSGFKKCKPLIDSWCVKQIGLFWELQTRHKFSEKHDGLTAILCQCY